MTSPRDLRNQAQAMVEGLNPLPRTSYSNDQTTYEVKRTQLRNGLFIVERQKTLTEISDRVVWKSNWETKLRFNCFCCSCSDYSTDSYCRNHGGVSGSRPCEVHEQPGFPDEYSGKMPESVQAHRRKVGFDD